MSIINVSTVPILTSSLERLRAGDQVEYFFVSHTGFGGVAYAMAITCLRLQAEAQLKAASSSSPGRSDVYSSVLLPENEAVVRPVENIEAFRQGDYRDILSLTRVIANGPASKSEVDSVIDR